MLTEGTEGLKRSYELGQHSGSLRKTKELVAWAKKRRRTIPREELISFLSGKPLRHRHSNNRTTRLEPRYNNESNLQFFRDAMALQTQSQSSLKIFIVLLIVYVTISKLYLYESINLSIKNLINLLKKLHLCNVLAIVTKPSISEKIFYNCYEVCDRI